jgi:thiol:disulfide interchange protein DsbC
MKIAALFATVTALAVLPVHADATTDFIKAEIKKQMADAPPVDSVRKTQYNDLYEVVAGGEVFYTNDKATFLALGPLVDLKTKENLTEARMRQLNHVKFNELPLDSAIKIVRGNGSRKIALFEDPNCGYCKRFERDFQGVTDVTAYVFLYPILAADSFDKSKAIWCSSDPGKAWIDAMVRDRLPSTQGTCTNPLEKNLAFGQAKHIRGTPTMIFENGERIPGAISMADLEKRFSEAKTAAPAATVPAK